MGAPFEPGDVVVCVDDYADLPPEDWNPIRGRYYRVAAVFQGFSYGLVEHPPTVDLVEDPAVDPDWGWPCPMFRKIDDEQIPEVLERLKAIGKRPKVSA